MPKRRPRLSIIIPAYNEASFIGPCLDAISQQTILPEEVIVVDNNSTDQTAKIAQKYPFVTFLREKEQGMIPARNTGFAAASGDLLARIDADTRIPPTWVATVHALTDRHAKGVYGITGPHYLYDISSRVAQKIETALISTFGYFVLTRWMLRHETLFGSNMVITKKAWNIIKNDVCLDSMSVHEDIDLAIHLGAFGPIVYSDAMIAGISSRPFFEPFRKKLWRLRLWTSTINRHRPLFSTTV